MTEQLHFHFSLSCIGEGNGNPLQCSCLENPRDRGAWWAAAYGVAQSRIWLKWLSSSSSRKCHPLQLHYWLIVMDRPTKSLLWYICFFFKEKKFWVLIYLLFRCVRHFKLEKAMATHSSTLAWKIAWTEEPGRLQSLGLGRVGHDWATSLSLFIFMHWRRKWQPNPVFWPGESQGWGSLVGCRLWGLTELDTTEVT